MSYLYKIRFHDNLLAGRELYLRDGPFTLGKEQADLFATPETYTNNIILQVSEQGITLETKYPVWIDGQTTLLDPDAILPCGVCLDVDGIRFSIGKPEDDLSSISPCPRNNRADKKQRGKVFYAALVSVVFIFLSLGGGGYVFSNAEADSTKQLDHITQVKGQLAVIQKNSQLSAVHFEWSDKDVLTITGWCKKESDVDKILALLKSSGINYTLNIVSQDGVLSNVEDVLQLNGFQNVHVAAGDGPGKIIILGQFEQNEQWQHVTQLLTDIPGLKSWQVKSTDDTELNALIEALRNAKLLSLMSVQRIDERIILSGKLNHTQRNTLSVVMRKHMQAFASAEEIIYQNINTGAGALGVFPSPVVSVGGNSQSPYLELENGSRLQVGARLPGGYRIQSIDEENGIELVRQGEMLHVPFNF